jgi:hypothetical protein
MSTNSFIINIRMSDARRVLSALWERIIHPADSLGIARIDMPQIHFADVPAFEAFLHEHGIETSEEDVPTASLKPTQNELNDDALTHITPAVFQQKHTQVSSDNYIFDGHHRWLYAKTNNIPTMRVFRYHAPIRTLLQVARNFSKTDHQDINNATEV